jgi:hypothetical protein
VGRDEMLNDTILAWVIGVFGSICGIYFGYVGYKRTERKDNLREGKESATLFSDIGYIKSGIDDLKRKQEKSDERHIEIITRLTSVEASTKQAHKRIDEIIEKE